MRDRPWPSARPGKLPSAKAVYVVEAKRDYVPMSADKRATASSDGPQERIINGGFWTLQAQARAMLAAAWLSE